MKQGMDREKRERNLDKVNKALKTVGATLHLGQSSLKDLRFALRELEGLRDIKVSRACAVLQGLIAEKVNVVRKAKREREKMEELRDKIVRSLKDNEKQGEINYES